MKLFGLIFIISFFSIHKIVAYDIVFINNQEALNEYKNIKIKRSKIANLFIDQMNIDSVLSLFDDITECKKISITQCSGTNFEKFFENLKCKNSVKTLSFEKLNINDYQAIFNCLPNLEEITIEQCNFSDIRNLFHLKELKHLELRECIIDSLPIEFSEKLKNLNYLYLIDALEFVSVRKSISPLFELPNISSLIIDLNIASDTIIDLSKYTKLKDLELSKLPDHYNIKLILPKDNSLDMFAIHKSRLDLEHVLTFISNSNINYDSLKRFSISCMQFKEIPKFILKFKNLEGLYLSENKINNIDFEWGAFKKLNDIGLYNNCIDKIPDSFAKFYNSNMEVNLQYNFLGIEDMQKYDSFTKTQHK